MKIFKDRKELTLLGLTIVSAILLILIKINFPLTSCINADDYLGKFLVSSSTKEVSSNLLISILAAYIFYIFVDLVPRAKKDKDSIRVLNALIASVLDAYDRSRMFGHETAINQIPTTTLRDEWLDKHIKVMQEDKADLLSLKHAMETAVVRENDFRNVLPLALGLSPQHVLLWLVMIDKIRLLAEMEERCLLAHDTPILRQDLELRLLEILEQTQDWLKLI